MTENEITGDILDASIKLHREYSLCASASLRDTKSDANNHPTPTLSASASLRE